MDLVAKYEQEKIEKLKNNKIDNFKSGDTVKVNVKITEGTTDRIQVYKGVVIAKSNKGLSSSFVVLKISHGGIGIKRLFMLYSPKIHSVELLKESIVRRAKLYYLENKRGKSARIKEKLY